jgi:2-polyprenyl-3-methyl-5-hydroxy-6-metoxy-1,4-benzoquinol methylase
MTAQEFGFHAVGVDLRKDNVEKLRRLGVEAHDQDIMTFDASHDGRYRVVSMADVLEHMPYPKRVLQKVHAMMEPGGILLVSLPNKDAILWKVMTANGRNPYLAEIEHYHNFGRQRLYELLEETGFEPVRYGVSERYVVGMEVLARKKA